MAKPTTKAMVELMEKTRFLNRRGGRTGSFARRSTATNATTSSTPATPRMTIGAEPQAYVVPPRLVIMTRLVAARAIRIAPR